MIKIDGREIAGEILENLKKIGTSQKKLAFLSFERSDAFESFISEQLRVANSLGISARVLYKAETKNTQELIDDLRRLGDSEDGGGIILQMPLPKRFDKQAILAAIPIAKDVDRLNPATQAVSAPAVVAMEKIIAHVAAGIPIVWAGCRVCVVGAGMLIGRPIRQYFDGKGASVTMLNSKSSLVEIAEADVVITGTGVPKLIRSEMLGYGTFLVDFGYPGDVDDSDPGLDKIGWYAPAKGGTGPILVACMFENFYRLNGLLK